jgi:hypothetical protein
MLATSDLLSSSSLLLAVLAVLLGLWYGEVAAASKKGAGGLNQSQMDELKRDLKPVLWKRAIPLAAASGAVAAVFVYRAALLTCETLNCWFGSGRSCTYNEISAAFLVTEALTLFVFVVTIVKVGRIIKTLNAKL